MIEIIIVAVIAFALGHRISTIFHVLSFKRILDELGVTREQMIQLARKNGMDLSEIEPSKDQFTETAEKILAVKLEQHGEQIYAFRKDTDQFLGQGPDADSLILRLGETLKPCRIKISKEDGAELLQKNNG